jgi:hypothetical protein
VGVQLGEYVRGGAHLGRVGRGLHGSVKLAEKLEEAIVGVLVSGEGKSGGG